MNAAPAYGMEQGDGSKAAQLQAQFNRHLFKLEKEEYEREGIDVGGVTFEDNQLCLDLIEQKPVGVLSLLDEQCAFPKATDKTFAGKLASEVKNPRFSADKRDAMRFTVSHYAGDVAYDAGGWLDKNKDGCTPISPPSSATATGP